MYSNLSTSADSQRGSVELARSIASRDSLNHFSRVRKIAEIAFVEISLSRIAFNSSITGSGSFSNSAGLPFVVASGAAELGFNFLLTGPCSGLSSGKDIPLGTASPFCPLACVTR